MRYLPQFFTLLVLLFNTFSAYLARLELNHKLEAFFLKVELSQLQIAAEAKELFYKKFSNLECRFDTLTTLTQAKFDSVREEQLLVSKELKTSLHEFNLANVHRDSEIVSKLEAFKSSSKIESINSTLDYALQLGITSVKLVGFAVVVVGCVYGAYHSYAFLNAISQDILKQPGLLFTKFTSGSSAVPMSSTEAFQNIPLVPPVIHIIPERSHSITIIDPVGDARFDSIFDNLDDADL